MGLGEYMRHFLKKRNKLVRVTVTVVWTVMNLVVTEVGSWYSLEREEVRGP